MSNKRLVFPSLLILFFVGLVVLRVVRGTSLPFDFFSKSLVEPLGTPSQEEEFERKLARFGLLPEGLIFEEEGIQASLSAGLTVFFSREKDLSGQVASLQFILSRTKIEGKTPKVIDLRFEKPILKY